MGTTMRTWELGRPAHAACVCNSGYIALFFFTTDTSNGIGLPDHVGHAANSFPTATSGCVPDS